MNISDLISRIVAFRDARDWKQFHAPDKLAAAISIESAEIQEHFLWKTPDEVSQMASDPATVRAIGEEIADTLILSLLLAHDLGLDAAEIVKQKIALNEQKYPVELARGNSQKYNKLRT